MQSNKIHETQPRYSRKSRLFRSFRGGQHRPHISLSMETACPTDGIIVEPHRSLAVSAKGRYTGNSGSTTETEQNGGMPCMELTHNGGISDSESFFKRQ